MDPYREAVAGLPRPTPGQTRAFVRYASNAHSWYKHLPPVPPGTAMQFYLDPAAGRLVCYTPSGEIAFRRVEREEQPFHYSTLPTDEYLERFGHWNYRCDAGTTVMSVSAAGLEATGDRSPGVLDASGDWIEVPDDLARAGEVHVTGLVHHVRPLVKCGHEEWIAALRELPRPASLAAYPDLLLEYFPPALPRGPAMLEEEARRVFEGLWHAERDREHEEMASAMERFLSALDARQG